MPCQNGATLSMILIFFPVTVRITDNLEKEGEVSNEIIGSYVCTHAYNA